MEENGLGVVLLVCSVMLSRGLDNIQADLESGGFLPTLIGNHDYAGQVRSHVQSNDLEQQRLAVLCDVMTVLLFSNS